MRILFIHQNFPGQFRFLAETLVKRTHGVVALGINSPSLAIKGIAHILHKPIQPTGNLPAIPGLGDLAAKLTRARSVTEQMCKLKQQGFYPDVIYAHPGWGETLNAKTVFPKARLVIYAEYYYGQPGGDLAFDPEFPPSLTNEADELSRIGAKNLSLLQGLAEADLAISPTVFQKTQHPFWAQPKIQVVHDGIDTLRFTPDRDAKVHLKRAGLTLRAGDEVVTYVARHLEPYRGYHQFMRALPRLMAMRPACHVVIVGGEGSSYGPAAPAGTTWKQHYLSEVETQIDMKRVHFVGAVPHHILTQLMQVSAVHVYLTYPFVLSWSLMEAMACGCTIVASDTAPVREVIFDGHTGRLVNFFDPVAMADTIVNTLADKQEWQRLASNARALIVDKYDLHRVCLPRQLSLLDL